MALKIDQMKLGVKFAGIVAKSAAIGKINKKAGRKYLLETLGSMPGLTAKAAQILATKLDMAPQDFHKELEPLGIDAVKDIIEKSCPKLSERLVMIDPEPRKASLGQVHKGVLDDETVVAIKVQYPNIGQDLENHVGLLMSVSDMGPQRKYGMDMPSYKDFFTESFNKEIQYRQEAANQQRYASIMPDDCGLSVPKVLTHLSTETILTQGFESGVSLETVRQFWPEDARRECALILCNSFLESLFKHGYVHSDPHPGNFAFRTKTKGHGTYAHEVIQYDYGSVLEISTERRQTLLSLVWAYRQNKAIIPYDYLVHLGFDPSHLSYIADKLPALMARFLEPLTSPAAYDIKDWNLAGNFGNILGDDKWWFRTAGPPWFLMLIRAVQGVGHILSELGTPVPIGRIFGQITQGLDREVVVPKYHQHQETPSGISLSDCAQNLMVQVIEKATGNQVVHLTMPARSVDCLEEIIPPETLEKIASLHDIVAIKSQAQMGGYKPGILFDAETTERAYKVWLK